MNCLSRNKQMLPSMVNKSVFLFLLIYMYVFQSSCNYFGTVNFFFFFCMVESFGSKRGKFMKAREQECLKCILNLGNWSLILRFYGLAVCYCHISQLTSHMLQCITAKVNVINVFAFQLFLFRKLYESLVFFSLNLLTVLFILKYLNYFRGQIRCCAPHQFYLFCLLSSYILYFQCPDSRYTVRVVKQ